MAVAATRRGLWLAGLFLALVFGSAHVGSNTVFFEGTAGPYPIRVIIHPPKVIPGLADIVVRVKGGGADAVTVQPFRWDAGPAGAPRPDPAMPVAGDPELHSAQLWIMTSGAYSVHVAVTGPRGSGTAIVPLNAVRTDVLEMRRPRAVLLLGMGLLLLIGAVTIVGAAVRESVLPPGEAPSPRRGRTAAIAMAGSSVLLVAAGYGGKLWWDRERRAALQDVFTSLAVETSVSAAPDGRILTLEITDPAWRNRQRAPLVPDHGKLMHLFAVRDDFGAFGHLHPVPVDSNAFRVRLPAELPSGRYRVYADIVDETGFAQTLADTTDIPAPAATRVRPGDPDDSWVVGTPAIATPRVRRTADTLRDGSVITWIAEASPRVGRESTLRFRVTGPDGRPARLEPYTGMASHAAVSRNDGTVFVHLHPNGSISPAALQTFALRTPADTMRGALGRRMSGMPFMYMAHQTVGDVEFPFAFPQSGTYRMWVQVKRAGAIHTGTFDIVVP